MNNIRENKYNNISTIAVNQDFLLQLAKEIILQDLKNQVDLSRIVILLPTNRMIIELRSILAQHNIVAMPRMYSFADGKILQHLFPQYIDDLSVINDPISHQELLLVVTKIILSKESLNIYLPSQALKLAMKIVNLLYEMQNAEIDLDKLNYLDVSNYSEHWQEVAKFLAILSEDLQNYFIQNKIISAIEYRVAITNMLANLITTRPLQDKIIAVADLQNIKSVNKLLKAISGYEFGQVVIPWLECINYADHYNAAISKLKNDLECDDIIGNDILLDAFTGNILAENNQLSHCNIIHTSNMQQEALIISLIIKKILYSKPNEKIAIVTDNRELVCYIKNHIKAYGVIIDDSEGEKVISSDIANLWHLLINAIWNNFAPDSFIALVKHPFFNIESIDRGELLKQLRMAEKKVFAGVLSTKNTQELLNNTHYNLLQQAANILINYSSLITVMLQNNKIDYYQVILELEKIILAISYKQNNKINPQNRAFSEAITELKENIKILDYAGKDCFSQVFTILLNSVVYRVEYGVHPNVTILSLEQAKYLYFDNVIIPSFIDGNFPQIQNIDPWLSAAMRNDLGLKNAIEAKSYQFLNFHHLLFSQNTYITVPAKISGSPTIKSPWLLMIELYFNKLGVNHEAQEYWLNIVNNMYDSAKIDYVRPEPKIANEYKPKKLSVTNIELLMRNPYELYAKKILSLPKIDDVDMDPDARDFGKIIHKIMENITEDNIINNVMIKYNQHPISNFWQEKIGALMKYMQDFDQNNRKKTQKIFVEITGETSISLDNNKIFLITGCADRIENQDDHIVIYDFKTGVLPSKTDISSGYKPQLPLLAIIAQNRGFLSIDDVKPIYFAYVKIKTNGCGLEIKEFALDDAEMLIQDSYEGLKYILNYYENEETPYYCLIGEHDVGDEYAHLARAI
jgi:inactivated superfamily I helicase/RecB family exonuclease